VAICAQPEKNARDVAAAMSRIRVGIVDCLRFIGLGRLIWIGGINREILSSMHKFAYGTLGPGGHRREIHAASLGAPV